MNISHSAVFRLSFWQTMRSKKLLSQNLFLKPILQDIKKRYKIKSLEEMNSPWISFHPPLVP